MESCNLKITDHAGMHQAHPGGSAVMANELQQILAQVQERAGKDFSGVGLIVCDTPERLPICSLRPVSTYSNGHDLVSMLAAISSIHSEYHDGFHIVSSGWKLLKVAQYFSPAIVAGADIDRSRRFGGRYLAGLFGSALPSVQACGIASNGFGIAIFQSGVEVFFKANR